MPRGILDLAPALTRTRFFKLAGWDGTIATLLLAGLLGFKKIHNTRISRLEVAEMRLHSKECSGED